MIEGVIIKPIRKFPDERGWLAELYREDELAGIPRPAMAYISVTHPGIARGPHEHVFQTDYFCFLGPSNFKIWLWDNRKTSLTFGQNMTICAGQDHPMMVIVPPGVVHGYKNIGIEAGTVVNFPDKLYKGPGKKEAVDEIRHEDDVNSLFKME
jgi:dTDP-4-dehydrorhamnose 3,5-epimerase